MRLTSVALLVVVAVAQAAAPAVPSPEEILSTLRAKHPRLIILNEDVARTRKLIETDAQAARMLAQLKRAAEKMADSGPLEYRLIGPRLLDQSRKCLRRVYAFATLYRLEGDVKYVQMAEADMLAAAAFPDWNPKHFLDTAEMCHALGIGYDWLYDQLPPSSRKAIRTSIVEKGLKPAEEVYRKNRWWARGTANWNQVCNGGIAIGALAVADEEPKLAGYILSEATASIRLPTARLDPDGGWDEGPGYWNYAMSYTADYMAAMQTGLGGDLGLGGFAGLADTGLFRIYCIGPIGRTFNYADAGEDPGGATEMFFFARRFDRPVYAYHHRKHLDGVSGLDLLWYDPRGGEQDLLKLPLDRRFENIDVAFLRGAWDFDATFVGFKGGDNAAGHSHLDLGTFVLDAAGRRWAMDLGGDDYALPGYFGKERWTYYRLGTEGHNTLLIEGENQATKAKAPMIAFESAPQRSFAIADLSAAYAKHASKVLRGVALVDRTAVVVQDEIEADRPLEIEWAMHTKAEVKIDGPEVLLEQNDRQLRMRAVKAAGGTWSVRPVNIHPPQRQESGINRLALCFKAVGPRTRVVIEMRPVKAGQPAPPPAEVKPLAEWGGHPAPPSAP